MLITQMSRESSISVLRRSLTHGLPTFISMSVSFSAKVVAHWMDVSPTHKFIKDPSNGGDLDAFGENDGMVAVSSARWVRRDRSRYLPLSLNPWSRVSSSVF